MEYFVANSNGELENASEIPSSQYNHEQEPFHYVESYVCGYIVPNEFKYTHPINDNAVGIDEEDDTYERYETEYGKEHEEINDDGRQIECLPTLWLFHKRKYKSLKRNSKYEACSQTRS